MLVPVCIYAFLFMCVFVLLFVCFWPQHAIKCACISFRVNECLCEAAHIRVRVSVRATVRVRVCVRLCIYLP